MYRLIALSILLITLSGCSSSSSPGGSGDTGVISSSFGTVKSGKVTLTGGDASNYNGVLDTGYVGASPSIIVNGVNTSTNYIMIVDSASTVASPDGVSMTPRPGDPNNSVVLTVVDSEPVKQGAGIVVSLTIIKNGIAAGYGCTTTLGIGIDCGSNSISMDFSGRSITFTNMSVINQATSTVMTLDGTLTW